MAQLSLYDDAKIERLVELQKKHAWDLESSIHWDQKIDLDKPLVPLDKDAFFFPSATPKQRTLISQLMGLVIAAGTCEMEECLCRLRTESWDQVFEKRPVNPELKELGDLFYEEEKKHAQTFRRYLSQFAETLGVDLPTLLSVLPVVENSRTEKVLRRTLNFGGYPFWWIVANVEQQFLLVYYALKPFQDDLEPLYFEVQEKHFEEEARHAPFPYLALELMAENQRGALGAIHRKADFAVAQIIGTLWTFNAVQKLNRVKALEGVHPFFKELGGLYPLLEEWSVVEMIWSLMTDAPYLSSLINMQTHRQLTRFAKKMGSIVVPYPTCQPKKLVRY